MIEVFADLNCPYTYVGLTRILARRDDLGRDDPVLVKAWPLELVNGEPLRSSLLEEEVTELRRTVAPDLFGGFAPERLPRSTIPPLALAAAAYRVGAQTGERVSIALRRALFEEGSDISAPDVLERIRRLHGLPDEPLDTNAVEAEWREGQRRGVVGSPHFFVGDTDFFCPSLRITFVGEHLRIAVDEEGFEGFIRVAFPEVVTC